MVMHFKHQIGYENIEERDDGEGDAELILDRKQVKQLS